MNHIEKSGFHRGQYVGYGGGRVWRIVKKKHGWHAHTQPDGKAHQEYDTITLQEMERVLAGLDVRGNPTKRKPRNPTVQKTASIPTNQLQVGDIVWAHGARFRLLTKNRSQSHSPKHGGVSWFTTKLLNDGGTIPKSWLKDWIIQGNDLARWSTEMRIADIRRVKHNPTKRKRKSPVKTFREFMTKPLFSKKQHAKMATMRKRHLKRKKNPTLRYIIVVSKKGTKRMWFNGDNFSSELPPVEFTSTGAALTKAQILLRRYPILDKYKMTVEDKPVGK